MEKKLNSRKNELVALVLALTLVVCCIQGSWAVGLCNISSDDLLECKPAVTAPNPESPTPKCCAALGNADLTCLCSYKNSSELFFLGIDPDLAMALPTKCNLSPPPGC